MSEYGQSYGMTEAQRAEAISTVSVVAHVAAAGIFGGFNPEERRGETQNDYWYADGVMNAGTIGADELASAEALASFQFGQAATGETLYRQAIYDGLHDLPRDGFAEQPARVRLAYQIFASTAVAAFEALGAECAKTRDAEVPIGVVRIDRDLHERIGQDQESMSDREEASVELATKATRGQTPQEKAAVAAAKKAETARLKAALKTAADESAGAMNQLHAMIDAATITVTRTIKRGLGEREAAALVTWLDAQTVFDVEPLKDKAIALQAIGAAAEPPAPTPVTKAPADYDIVVEPLSAENGGGFVATVPELPGCLSDGATEAEARANVRDAIVTWLDAAADKTPAT